MNPNVTSLASSIISDPRYEALKVASYEKVKDWTYADPSNAFGHYMGVMKFFEALTEWSKEGTATKLKQEKAKKNEGQPAEREPDPDLV